mmetsp:Transcript_79727/g.205088  ORF Transcript_79727/g.205088 Transcript_79727/m.205088 type:complete len:217 (+) Transcript_79727:678-1328(+)
MVPCAGHRGRRGPTQHGLLLSLGKRTRVVNAASGVLECRDRDRHGRLLAQKVRANAEGLDAVVVHLGEQRLELTVDLVPEARLLLPPLQGIDGDALHLQLVADARQGEIYVDKAVTAESLHDRQDVELRAGVAALADLRRGAAAIPQVVLDVLHAPAQVLRVRAHVFLEPLAQDDHIAAQRRDALVDGVAAGQDAAHLGREDVDIAPERVPVVLIL